MKSSMQLLSTLNKTLKNQNKNLLKQHFCLMRASFKGKDSPLQTFHTVQDLFSYEFKTKILINSIATLGLNTQR
ncbi:hypothetical protein DB44_BY00460 [Candidatus Protochlamydia amoebophila]|uniref:Uncharacterized protein n=1 Tax=Candidatus Protochlamydia amoebophila TaxID=362787 RepID=A0A0C1HDU1_9BACT|nr:hypothetical protein DB44_BY00460 [Candidatus Protochlamydia amoebophila]